MKPVAWSILISVAACAAWAGPADGPLGDLPNAKAFRAARQSSFDPSGGNSDGRQDWPIGPGETRDMAAVEGAGAITHIWVTIASSDRYHLRNLVLRMYWDGEETPSVEAPIGDFFGLGWAQYYQYASLPIQIGTNNALNCFWRMPFSKGARVTVTNDGPVQVDAFYYYVDYQVYETPPEHMLRFHAQYRQAYPCAPGRNYTLLEAAGRGHYAGCNQSIHNRADGWWGEGDDMIYVDGEEKPSLHGTGSEDYYCGAWCYGDAFSNAYFGCPLRGEHKRNEFWNVYRYHIEDPVPFTKSIRVTIEHGHANDRGDDFSSVAYWYQEEPHAPFPALPPAEARMPEGSQVFVEPAALEMESLASEFTGGPLEVQGMDSYGKWSDARQLWFRPEGPTVYTLRFDMPQPLAGAYRCELWYTKAPDYGQVEIWLNGSQVGGWDGYNADGVVRAKVEAGAALDAGENVLEVRVVGLNEHSTGYMAGIDCLRPKRVP